MYEANPLLKAASAMAISLVILLPQNMNYLDGGRGYVADLSDVSY